MECFKLDICASVNAPGCWITLRSHIQILMDAFCETLTRLQPCCFGCSTRLLSSKLITFIPLISMRASHLSWCQCVIYYSWNLQYILYMCTRLNVPMTGSSAASTSPAKWQQLYCRAAGNNDLLFISIWSMTEHNRVDFLLSPALSLSPMLHPCSLEGLEPRAGSVLRGTRGSWQGWLEERGEPTDAAWVEETGACKCCFGPLTKHCLTCCQDNHSTSRNG